MTSQPTHPPPTTISSQTSSRFIEQLPISEMRALHSRALAEAESKRTELRLVLSSRYRDLVGSSDEVVKMEGIGNEIYKEILELNSLLVGQRWSKRDVLGGKKGVIKEEEKGEEEDELLVIREEISMLTRKIHRCMDNKDPKNASQSILRLFSIIKSLQNEGAHFPLAEKLGTITNDLSSMPKKNDAHLQMQIRMTYLHMESMPYRIIQLCEGVLSHKATSVKESEGALYGMALLESKTMTSAGSSNKLLDTYYECKSKLLNSLLEKLKTAEDIEILMSQIVQVLQYDIILHSYCLFFPFSSTAEEQHLSFLEFDATSVKTKCSQLLCSYIPLIRNRMKQMLVSISVNADQLGRVRQTLYDCTNAVVSNSDQWDPALHHLVDLTILSSTQSSSSSSNTPRAAATAPPSSSTSPFNLWSALFSTTFSSLVHDLLSSSFTNVHTGTMETLRRSLSRAPQTTLLPHEAHRNTHILTHLLDASLCKLSTDAHVLLVHAEERTESTIRLRQSLYVQTCEIMGRLLSEIRRLSSHDTSTPQQDGIIARLAYNMKFQLKSLGTLLSPSHAPALSNRIRLEDLRTSFDIADVDGDERVSYTEAIEVLNGAFSGTGFDVTDAIRSAFPVSEEEGDATLLELALLSAKGLKHDDAGDGSALGMIQSSLDSIVGHCLRKWAKMILKDKDELLVQGLEQIWTSRTVDTASSQTLSLPVTGYLLSIASIVNASICPADSLTLVPSNKEASALGITRDASEIPNFLTVIRKALANQALYSLCEAFTWTLDLEDDQGEKIAPTASSLVQFHVDIQWIQHCFHNILVGSSNENGDTEEDEHPCVPMLAELQSQLDSQLQENEIDIDPDTFEKAKHNFTSSCYLYLSALFQDTTTTTPTLEVQSSSDITTFIEPIPSSKRFTLLQVQDDAKMNEYALRNKSSGNVQDYGKKEESSAPASGSSWFGFGGMLKKK